MTLTGTALACWDNLYNKIPVGDPLDFRVHIDQFIHSFCMPSSRAQQISYVRLLKKSRSDDVAFFKIAQETLLDFATWMPGDEEIPNEAECKRIFFDAMPFKWHENFTMAGNDAATKSFSEIEQYMHLQECYSISNHDGKTSFSKNKNYNNGKSDNNNYNNNYQKHQHENSSNGKGKKYFKKSHDNDSSKDNKNSKDNKKSSHLADDAPCPIHLNCAKPHTWGTCFENAHNKNKNNKHGKSSDNSNTSTAAQAVTNESNTGESINDKPVETIIGKHSVCCCSMQCESLFHINTSHHFDNFSFQESSEAMLLPVKEATQKTVENYFSGQTSELMENLHENRNDFLVYESDSKIKPTSKIEVMNTNKKSPSTILIINHIQNVEFREPLKALFDSGSDSSFLQKRCLPKNVECNKVSCSVTGITGTAKFTEQVIISEMILPEFSHSVRISAKITVTLIDSVSHYDLILGRDFCSAVGIDVLHSTQEVVW